MPVTSLGSPIGSSTLATGAGNNASAANAVFRSADFLKIMLAEITQQDPMNPQDTGKMVDGMRKLQELESAKYQQFRDDMRWAQDLMGKDVTVQQMTITADELAKLKSMGLNPAQGFGSDTGTITNFRIVDQTVYVNVDGKDYPITNVGQVHPPKSDPAQLAGIAENLLGKRVGYYGEDRATRGSGIVTAVTSHEDREISLTINGVDVPFSHILSIAKP